MLKIIARISIILFGLAMLPVADLIWNTNAFNPFYLKEIMVASLVMSSITCMIIAFFEV
jgi:hypothetical protein|tara:strand:+ start:571 stop:747 length:177 start_codon:yes stop_codon:yes gene_type:complete